MDDLARIDALNVRLGIPGIAQVVAGNGGMLKVHVSAGGAAADVYLHGAQVTSWQPAGADEAIFLSRRAHWAAGRAIRGGIPICFPWFRAKADDPKAPAHGFVRTREWNLDSIQAAADGSVVILCSTESDDSTRQWWPHEFRLVHRITVGRTLQLELTAANTGAGPFRFEEALHSYFRVGQAQSARVRGLDQAAYLDNTDGNRKKVQKGDVALAAPTDNAYMDTRSPLELVDPVLRRTIKTAKENSATTVVWNPWQQGAASLSDLGEEEWQQFVCVEASNILDSAIELSLGEEHTLCAILSVTAHESA
jgi:glucose-6-phosphate 1-epimerase